MNAHTYAVDPRDIKSWYYMEESTEYDDAKDRIDSGEQGGFIISNRDDPTGEGRECFCLAVKAGSGEVEEFLIIPKLIRNGDTPATQIAGIAFEKSPEGVEPDGFETLNLLVFHCKSHPLEPLEFTLKLDEEDDEEEEEEEYKVADNYGRETEIAMEQKMIAPEERTSSMLAASSVSTHIGGMAEADVHEVVRYYVVDPAFEQSHKAFLASKKAEKIAEGGGTKRLSGKSKSSKGNGSTKGSTVMLLENEAAHQSDMLLWSDFKHDLKWPELDKLIGKPEVLSLQWLDSGSTSDSGSSVNGKNPAPNDLLAVLVEVSNKKIRENKRERNFRVAVYQPKSGELSYVISRQFKGGNPAKPEVRWVAATKTEGNPTLIFFNDDPDPAPRFFDVVQIKTSEDGTITVAGGRQNSGVHVTRSRAPLGDFGLSLGKATVKFAGEEDRMELARAIVSRPSEEDAKGDEKTASDPNAQLWAPVHDAPLMIVDKASQKAEKLKRTAAIVMPSDVIVKKCEATMFKEWPGGAGDIINMQNSDGHSVALGKSKLYCGIAKPKVPAEYSCISTTGVNYYNDTDLSATTVVKMVAGNWTVDFKPAVGRQAITYFGNEKYTFDQISGADTFTGKCESKGQTLAQGENGSNELLVQSMIGSANSHMSYYGIFFDVTAEVDVELVYILAGSEGKGPSSGTLFFREGTHKGFESSPSGWETACREVKLTTNGGSVTALDEPIVLQAGQTLGFYCHGPAHNESVAYVKDEGGNYSWQGDTDVLTLSTGRPSTSATPFHDVNSDARQFAGGIGFNVLTTGDEVDASAEPTLAAMPGQIRKAVINGVPLWNAKNYASCTKLYSDVAQRYRHLEPLLDNALAECEEKPDNDSSVTSRGWILRRTFNSLLDNRVELRPKEPLVTGALTVSGSNLHVEWTNDHRNLEGFTLKSKHDSPVNGTYVKCRLKDEYAQLETAGAETYQNSKSKQFVMLRWTTVDVIVRALTEGEQAESSKKVDEGDVITEAGKKTHL